LADNDMYSQRSSSVPVTMENGAGREGSSHASNSHGNNVERGVKRANLPDPVLLMIV